MDYIPSIQTETPNPELLKYVNTLINEEMSNTDTSQPHPSIPTSHTIHNNKLLPLSSNGFGMTPISEKYTSNGVDYELIASYSQLRYLRSTSMHSIINNTQSLNNLLTLEHNDLQNNNKDLSTLLNKKRAAVDELKSNRQKQIKSFHPINNFLLNRWNEKVNQLLDIEINKYNK